MLSNEIKSASDSEQGSGRKERENENENGVGSTHTSRTQGGQMHMMLNKKALTFNTDGLSC